MIEMKSQPAFEITSGTSLTACPRCGKETDQPFHTCMNKQSTTPETIKSLRDAIHYGKMRGDEVSLLVEAIQAIEQLERERDEAKKALAQMQLEFLELHEQRDAHKADAERLAEALNNLRGRMRISSRPYWTREELEHDCAECDSSLSAHNDLVKGNP